MIENLNKAFENRPSIHSPIGEHSGRQTINDTNT